MMEERTWVGKSARFMFGGDDGDAVLLGGHGVGYAGLDVFVDTVPGVDEGVVDREAFFVIDGVAIGVKAGSGAYDVRAVVVGDGVPHCGVYDVLETLVGGCLVAEGAAERQWVGDLVADHNVYDQPFLVPIGDLPGWDVGAEGPFVDAVDGVGEWHFGV